jgi:hypothetical protein
MTMKNIIKNIILFYNMDLKVEYDILYKKWESAFNEFYETFIYYNNLECSEQEKIINKYRIYIMFRLADDYKKQLDELKNKIEK